MLAAVEWLYDDVGRLLEEHFDFDYDPQIGFDADRSAEYTFDLVGNRLVMETDTTGDGEFNETVNYQYDANDRLLTEAKDVAGGTEDDRLTEYLYGDSNEKTQQTQKTVKLYTDGSGGTLEATTYDYNRQGRLGVVRIDSDADGNTNTQLEYEYDDSGTRVAQTKKVDDNDDGDFTDQGDSSERTEYVVDPQNPTGYVQVLEEWVDGAIAKSYTLGLDVIAQALSAATVHFLLYDGHGSTRGLVDATGQALSGQIYRYDAYGNPIGFDPAIAATSLLYSGEQLDQLTGLQYLRARYYDLCTGRFTRLDPFFGDVNNPQSLQKYGYVHADPITSIDPSGFAEFSLAGLAVRVGAFSALAGLFHGAIIGARRGAIGAITGAVLGAVAGFAFGFGLVYGAGVAAALIVKSAALVSYAVTFPTTVCSILIASHVGITALVIRNLSNANDGYELAASISDLVFVMVGWALLTRPLLRAPTQRGYTGRLFVGRGRAHKEALFELLEGDVTLDKNPGYEPHVVGEINTVDPATVEGVPFNEIIFERFPYSEFGPGAARNAAAMLKSGGRFEMHTGRTLVNDEPSLNAIGRFLEQAGFENIYLADWSWGAAGDVCVCATKR